MLGYTSALCAARKSFFARDPPFGRGEGPIWMDNLLCRGNEPSLDNCAFNGWGVHSCTHAEDAGLICAPGKNKLVHFRALCQTLRFKLPMMHLNIWTSYLPIATMRQCKSVNCVLLCLPAFISTFQQCQCKRIPTYYLSLTTSVLEHHPSSYIRCDSSLHQLFNYQLSRDAKIHIFLV